MTTTTPVDTAAVTPGPDSWPRPWAALYEGRVSSRPIEGSLPQFLRDAVARFPKHVALTDGAREVSYSSLWERSGRLGGALAAAGVRHGDRVALMLPNSIEYVIAFFAVVRAGAVVTQVNPLSVRRELEDVLADSTASALLVGVSAYERVRGFQAPASLHTTIVVGATTSALGEGAVSLAALLKTAPDPAEAAIDPVVDLAVIQYTGGTTGRPRGATHTHASLLGAVRQTISLLVENGDEFPPNAKAIAVAPLFHIFGTTMVLLFGLELGWNLLLMPRFEPARMLELIRREQPVMLAAVTAIFSALDARADLEHHGLDRVKLFVSGGAPVPPSLAQAFEARTGQPIWEGYGLSEAAPVAFNTYLAGTRPGSIGVPVPGTDVRLVDVETGSREVPVGEAGELLIRGPQVMRDYWRRPAETAAALEGGWLSTGDVARMSDDGFLEIVDRKKEMINVAGYKVYPREIEDVLYEHADVMETVVIGVPDARRGQAVKAFVALKPGATASAATLVAHCRTSLAPYKVPRIVELRERLPRSAVGKLLRRALAEEEQAKTRAVHTAHR